MMGNNGMQWFVTIDNASDSFLMFRKEASTHNYVATEAVRESIVVNELGSTKKAVNLDTAPRFLV